MPTFDSHDAEPTQVLLEGARSGDDRALAALLGRYRPRLRRWATGRLPAHARSKEDTDDLVQEALVAAVQRLPGIRDEGFHAYLRATILNRIRNHLRQAGVHERARQEAPLPAAEPSPLETLVGRDTLDRFDAALAELSVSDRELIVGHVDFHLPFDELAHIVGKPSANAARVALQRALVRLARAMDVDSDGGAR